ncbi:uncharacterized protein LOC121961568 [Plectropomus leopardus]|uniref:uncharacterized protein LOC121961568 n=1 Tax=Plectropomus leopardus TaxID=160734 RepID=UPI001C4BDD72|nr:uncharacterized protein LOC121961568 [Plectropomus leopardus]
MTKKFNNSAELDSFIKGVEEESKTKFITYSVDRHYNDKDWEPLPVNRVYWQWAGGSGMPAIEFTGIPFMFVGMKKLVCHQGKDLALAQKQRYAAEKAKKMMVDCSLGSHRSLRQDTKKVGCPAAISISKIATFPEFKVMENREWSKKTTSKMLRAALERDPVVWETRYAVSHQSEHAGHATGCSLPKRRRARKTDLRRTCVKLTEQIMEKIYITEDQHTLKELSQKLTTLLKDLTPQTRNEDGMPLHLQAKRVRVSSDVPVTTPSPQRSI